MVQISHVLYHKEIDTGKINLALTFAQFGVMNLGRGRQRDGRSR